MRALGLGFRVSSPKPQISPGAQGPGCPTGLLEAGPKSIEARVLSGGVAGLSVFGFMGCKPLSPHQKPSLTPFKNP